MAHFWDAIRGLIKAKSERYEFVYTMTRKQTAALINIQLAEEERILDSELWPDWNAKPEPKEEIDPDLIIESNRNAIEFLNKIP